MHQTRLRNLELAAVAAASLRVKEEVVLAQLLGNVRLQRDQVDGIPGVAPDRNRPGHVTMNQAERTAEEIDSGSDDRRPDPVVIQDQWLHEVIGVTAMVGRVDDASAARRRFDGFVVLADTFDLAKNGIERMFERAIDG